MTGGETARVVLDYSFEGPTTTTSSAATAMKVVSTFHPSSSVLSSVKCRLSTRDLEHLVVAKLNRIDVYSLRAHGLQHECGLEVWGKICSLKALKVSVRSRNRLRCKTKVDKSCRRSTKDGRTLSS